MTELDVQTWTPKIDWIGHDNGTVSMVPAKGGMWVSIADYNVQRAEIARLRTAAEDMRERAAMVAENHYGWFRGDRNVVLVAAAIRALPVAQEGK